MFSQLRSCRGEPALACPFGDAEHAGDFRVRISFNVVQNQRRSVSFRKIIHCPRNAFLEIRLRLGGRHLDRMRFVERDFPCNSYLAPSRVRNDSNHDSVQPGRERRVTAELSESRKRADKSVLSELTSLFRIAAQSIRERVHPRRVRVVQRTPGQPISRKDPGDELSFVHAVILSAVATMVAR